MARKRRRSRRSKPWSLVGVIVLLALIFALNGLSPADSLASYGGYILVLVGIGAAILGWWLVLWRRDRWKARTLKELQDMDPVAFERWVACSCSVDTA